MIKGKRIIGAILVGDITEVEALVSLIKKGTDISRYERKIESDNIDFRKIM